MNGLSVFALVLGASSLLVLLWADLKEQFRVQVLAKTLCSLGFLLLALSLGVDTRFGYWVFAGLVLSFFGDVLLLGRKDNWFLAGLVAFLLAHVAYIIAFIGLGTPSASRLVGVLLLSAYIVRWLWPYLGGWRVPVLAYCSVITLMLWTALGVPLTRVWLGALFFYASDIFVARGRFVRQDAWNALIGLPLYYLGQYLLAWAVG